MHLSRFFDWDTPQPLAMQMCVSESQSTKLDNSLLLPAHLLLKWYHFSHGVYNFLYNVSPTGYTAAVGNNFCADALEKYWAWSKHLGEVL